MLHVEGRFKANPETKTCGFCDNVLNSIKKTEKGKILRCTNKECGAEYIVETLTPLEQALTDLFKKYLFRTDGIQFYEGDKAFEYHIWKSKHGFGHIYYEKGIITQYSPVTGGHVTVAKY